MAQEEIGSERNNGGVQMVEHDAYGGYFCEKCNSSPANWCDTCGDLECNACRGHCAYDKKKRAEDKKNK